MKKVKQFKFENDKWIEYSDKNISYDLKTLKIGTFNVLFDVNHKQNYKPHIVCSKERYQAQMKELEKLSFDIITLNEVTKQYMDVLKSQDWVKKSYYVTDINGENIKNIGNVILSKMSFISVKGLKISSLSRLVLIGKLKIKVGDDEHFVFITSCHLKAVSSYYQQREKQLNSIYEYLDKKDKKSTKIILGDLNFHSDFEDQFIRDDYNDVWKKTSKDPGYTFDSVKNKMIYEMWPLGIEHRRMRLDRILMSSPLFEAEKVNFFLNDPIYPHNEDTSFDPIYYVRWPLRSITSQIFDIFEVNLWRDPKEYLFPSDHFGIYTTINLKSKL